MRETKFRRTVVMLTPDRQIDRRILLQADSLNDAGWQVTIIAMPNDTERNDDPRVVRIGSDNNEAIRENWVLDIYRWIRAHLPMNGFLMRGLKRLAWRYFVDQESFYTKLFFNTAMLYQPDVFVANDLPMLPVAKTVSELSNSKLVYDSHELFSEQEFSEWEKRVWAAIEAKYIRACDVVITVNPSIAKELERRYDISNVKVIYNAERALNLPICIKRFHQTFNLTTDQKVLLFQGGLSAGRNIETLVEAMQYVQISAVVLVVLGDGQLLQKLKRLVKAKSLNERVFFHPAVTQKDLLSFTIAADAGVIPYQPTCMNNFLCTPNKMFEFVASGIPILASDLPEIRKMVLERKIGLVGDTSTPEKLAVLIDNFFSDEQRLISWRNNLLVVKKQICWEEEEKKLVSIYEGLL